MDRSEYGSGNIKELLNYPQPSDTYNETRFANNSLIP